MNPLRQILSIRTVIILLLLAALLVTLWWLGPKLDMGGFVPFGLLLTRVLITVLLVTLTILVIFQGSLRLLWAAWKRRRDLARAERLGKRDQQAITEFDPDLRDSFLRRAEEVNRLSFGQGRERLRGSDLPWYAVIGTHASGKSSMLRQSGLDFVIQPEDMTVSELRTVDRCSWWVSEDGVFLELAGGYLAPPESPEHLLGWTSLMSLIKEQHPRRPLRGVILALSMEEMLALSLRERRGLATTLRARLQEMFHRLGTRLPVYIVVTKTDAVSGFAESMSALSDEDRAAAWGGVLPTDIEFQDIEAVRTMDSAFGQIVSDVGDRRNERLRVEHDVSRRLRIFEFPEQLRYILPRFSDLFREIFRASRFEAAPLCRGVFLTSALQAPQAVDMATGRLTAGLGVAAPAVVAAQSGDASFFLARFIRDFILPESGLASFDRQLEKRRTRRSLIGMGAAALLLVLVGILQNWGADVIESRMVKVRNDSLTLLSARNSLSQNASWESEVFVLNLGRAITEDYQGWAGTVISFAESLSHGFGHHSVSNAGRAMYERLLKHVFLPRIVYDMETTMNAAILSGDSASLLSTLTAYLMLNDPNHFNAQTVRNWTLADWQRDYYLSSDTKAALGQHLDELLKYLPRNIQLDQGLIAAARQQLTELPTAASVYAQLQVQAAADPSLPPFQRAVALGPGAALSLSASGAAGLNIQVPGFYTRQGFDTYILRKLPQQAAALSRDSWVLGPSPLSASGIGPNLLDQVASLYAADYIRQWDGVIAGLQLRQAPDLMTAIDSLSTLSGPDSPLSKLVNAVANNTNLVQPAASSGGSLLSAASSLVGGGQAGAAAAGGGSAGGAAAGGTATAAKTLGTAAANALGSSTSVFTTWPGAAIQTHFAPIIALSGNQAGGTAGAAAAAPAGAGAGAAPGGAPMDQVRSLIAGAYSLLQGVAAAPNPQFAAYNLLKAQTSGAVGNALSVILTQAPAYPAPISTIVRQVADSTSAILADLTGQYISMSWRQADGGTCAARLAGRYPFDSRSSADVALQDFQNFFKPGGTMDTFYTTVLQPLGIGSGIGGSASLLISAGTLASFQQAQRIRAAFFQNGQFGMSFTVTPHHLDPDAFNDTITYGGNSYVYQHQPPPTWNLTWPVTNGDPGLDFSVTSVKGNTDTTSFQGDWGLFRFVYGNLARGFGSSSSQKIAMTLDTLKASYVLSTGSLQSAFDPTTVVGFTCPRFN
ncbi:type VI secretion system membrane subunit TssM [Acidisoma sp. C75]